MSSKKKSANKPKAQKAASKKKGPSKKSAPKKVIPKNPSSNKPSSKKSSAKKPSSKKITPKKPAPKKTASKKIPDQKIKTPAQTSSKKKKAAPQKSAPQKLPPKKASPPKPAPKKSARKKQASKKARPKSSFLQNLQTELERILEKEGRITLRDSEGYTYCQEENCDQPSTTGGYCRFHYISSWAAIKEKALILSEDKLQKWVDQIAKDHSLSVLTLMIRDLSNEKDFASALSEMKAKQDFSFEEPREDFQE